MWAFALADHFKLEFSAVDLVMETRYAFIRLRALALRAADWLLLATSKIHHRKRGVEMRYQ